MYQIKALTTKHLPLNEIHDPMASKLIDQLRNSPLTIQENSTDWYLSDKLE